MTDQNEHQTLCPAPGCASRFPVDPLALGWHEYGELWWCPVHFYEEWHRLRRQAKEITWYDGAIRTGERDLADETAERDRELAAVRANRYNRRHPVPPEEEKRAARRIARSEQRIVTYTAQLDGLRRDRDNAVTRHELEDERHRSNLQLPENDAEK